MKTRGATWRAGGHLKCCSLWAPKSLLLNEALLHPSLAAHLSRPCPGTSGQRGTWIATSISEAHACHWQGQPQRARLPRMSAGPPPRLFATPTQPTMYLRWEISPHISSSQHTHTAPQYEASRC